MSGQNRPHDSFGADTLLSAAKVGALTGEFLLLDSRFQIPSLINIAILTEVFKYCRHSRFGLWWSCRSYQISQPSDPLSLLRHSLVCMRFNILVYAPSLFLKLFLTIANLTRDAEQHY